MLNTGGVARMVISPAQSISRSAILPPLSRSSLAPSPAFGLFPARSCSNNITSRCKKTGSFHSPQPSLPLLVPTPYYPSPFISSERAIRISEWNHRIYNQKGNAFRDKEFELQLLTCSAFNSGYSHHLSCELVLEFPVRGVRTSKAQHRWWKDFRSVALRSISVKAVFASVDDPRTKLNQKPLYDELQRYGLDESDYDSTTLNVTRKESDSSAATYKEVNRRAMPKKRKASSELTAAAKQQETPSLKDESGVVEDWCAYLLVSGDMKKTYVGVTYDIRRRLRQHNGEIAGGAKSARAGRPWRLVCTVHGFENRSEACQFEWTWKSTTAKVKVISKQDSKAVESPLITRRRATLSKVIESKEEWSNLNVQWRDGQ